MEKYLSDAKTIASKVDEQKDPEGCEEIMSIIRQVTALGVACGEINGMPERKTSEE